MAGGSATVVIVMLLSTVFGAEPVAVAPTYPALSCVAESTQSASRLICPGRVPLPLRAATFAGDRVETMVSAGQFLPAHEVSVDGAVFTVTIAEDGRSVSFLATSDAAFISPEGVSVGAAWKDLPSVVEGADPREEPGWACYTCLQSGWAAGVAFPSDQLEWPGPCTAWVSDESEIGWFFQRPGLCGN